jgi:hypothetical protein
MKANRHPPKCYNMKVFAVNEKSGLSLYLSNSGGSKYYLMTYRQNGLLWSLLKDGKSLDELRLLRPNSNRRMQTIYKSVRHILRVVDSYLQYEFELMA